MGCVESKEGVWRNKTHNGGKETVDKRGNKFYRP